MDTFSKDKRSRIMAAIHGRNTQPELLVRRYLFACGFRYRLNSPRLPGHPDLVLRKYRTCIFVNGCFWHGHDCGAFRLPRTNTDFWERKINRNRERDVEVQRRLAEMGWHCTTVWGCQLTKKQRELTLSSLALTLHRIYLQDRTTSLTPQPSSLTPSLTPHLSPLTPSVYPQHEEDRSLGIAAEPSPESSPESFSESSFSE